MAIEWDKIQENPDKNYKTQGVNLLNLKLKIELLEKNLAETTSTKERLKETKTSLESLTAELKRELNEKKESLATLEKEKKDLNEKIEKIKKDADEKIATLKENQKEEVETLNKKVLNATNKISSNESEIEKLSKEISNKNEKISGLENQVNEKANEITTLISNASKMKDENTNLKNRITELENLTIENEAELQKLKNELKEKESESIGSMNDLKNRVGVLKKELDEKSEKVKNMEEKIGELNKKLEISNTSAEKLKTQVEELTKGAPELREKIPKKPELEEEEEGEKTTKSGPCPKCGMTTFEEYKIVGGKKQTIRKYCPNAACGWRSAHVPTRTLVMSMEAPKEEVKELKIYVVRKDGIEETDSIDSKIVALVTDPVQNIIWIWKGKESSRFDYAEATTQATKVKETSGLFQAHVERVEEGNEPDNFPKIQES